ncbi:hypothetical protein Q9G87_59155 [Nonomuraea sp. G32]|nr:hypothetical protein [Nonomuraea sp. G32]MDP4511937.1 hypothetical protein [Nonomuraea sp. G32]
MSAVQIRFGSAALNFRLTRSDAATACLSAIVVRQPLRLLTPASPARRMSRATRLRPTRMPSISRRSAWMRGAP